ncbi:hypothetical protein MUK42_13983 [Musa troglodytarum]|uniref:CASP-like protein n=1 Tax=Musa troglodytarum TaxID=320322 RepID=A0A9E7ID52_9LILI|nr:hypothetical protein MUK42_13983 [Musa troglodytarum]URE49500.1 hypothetical protein MUK42_13983 [Musa troglodytarum]
MAASTEIDPESSRPTQMAPSTEIDPERASTSAAPSATNPAAVVLAIIAWWRRKELLERSALVLRPLALIFSLFAFIVCASNRHGDWRNFDRYEEYRYLLAISIFAFLYSAFQVSKQAYRFSTGNDLVPKNYSEIVDFAGDQTMKLATERWKMLHGELAPPRCWAYRSTSANGLQRSSHDDDCYH